MHDLFFKGLLLFIYFVIVYLEDIIKQIKKISSYLSAKQTIRLQDLSNNLKKFLATLNLKYKSRNPTSNEVIDLFI